MDKTIIPNYKLPSLLNVPSTFLKLLGANPIKNILPESYYKNSIGCEKVVFFLLDGFGHNLYQKVGLKYPFFKKYAEKGIYNPIQTVFPSTTAAAISTINSGLSPIEHGLPEWYLYFQELDAILESLPFTPAFKEDLDKLKAAPPKILFNQKTVYEYLNEVHVPSYIFLNRYLAESFYNIQANKGAVVIPYNTYPNLMVQLRKLLNKSKGKAYIYVYISAIDSAEHEFGPWAEEVEVEISSLSYLLEAEFVNKIDQNIANQIALFMTADHGQIATDPKETFYLDTIPGFKEFFKVGADGEPILPTGNVRDVLLNIKPEKQDEAIGLLKSKLPSGTQILKITNCIKQGWFGSGNTHQEFLNRTGDLLILPNGADTIWYHYTPESSYKFKGNHGGQSEDETLIPFVSAKLSDMQNNY